MFKLIVTTYTKDLRLKNNWVEEGSDTEKYGVNHHLDLNIVNRGTLSHILEGEKDGTIYHIRILKI